MSIVTIDLDEMIGVELDTLERGQTRCRELSLSGDEILVFNFVGDIPVTAEYMAGLLSAHTERYGESAIDYVEFVNPTQDHLEAINELATVIDG